MDICNLVELLDAGSVELPAASPQAPTCRLRYAVETALGGIFTIERPVPITKTLDEFVRSVRNLLITQDKISAGLVESYIVPYNLCTEEGVLLSDLHDFFEILPDSVISVSDCAGTCCALARYPLAWNVHLDNGLRGLVWTQVATTLTECKLNLFAQMRRLGIFHHSTDVDLTLLSHDGFETQIFSPMQMCRGVVKVPGSFTTGRADELSLQHPDLSDYDLTGVFDKFRSSKTGKLIRDLSCDWN